MAEADTGEQRELTDEELDERSKPVPYTNDRWAWFTEQAEALERRAAAKLDWKYLAELLQEEADGERDDWLNQCLWAIKLLLLIEHYPASGEQLRLWSRQLFGRRLELRTRDDLNPTLAKLQCEELLAEAWRIGREEAIREMMHLDVGEGSVPFAGEMKTYEERWERRLPKECPWTFEQIVGLKPGDIFRTIRTLPAGVKARLDEVLAVLGPDPEGYD